MAVDLFLRSDWRRSHTSSRLQSWQLEVMTLEQVRGGLGVFGLLDAEAAQKLAEASTTVVPQPRLDTIPLTTTADLAEIISPY